jgi:hypothetical protein
MRTVAWLLASLVLLATGGLGTYNGLTEWADARTGWQQSVTGGVFLYGLLGLAGAVGLLMRRRWSYPLAIAWGVVVTYVAAAAVLAYGGPDASIGAALAAGIGSAIIALLVVLAARVSTAAR